MSVARYKKLCKVPFDVRFLVIVGVLFAQHPIKHLAGFFFQVESGKTLLLLQVSKERSCCRPIYIDFIKLRETHIKVGRTKLSNLCGCTRRLLPELIARKIQNFQSLFRILLIERFQLFVLWSETTTRSRINYEQNFAAIVGQRH